MKKKRKSVKLTSGLLLYDEQGNYNLKNNKNRNRVLIKRKRQGKKEGRLKEKARNREDQWNISEEKLEKGRSTRAQKRGSPWPKKSLPKSLFWSSRRAISTWK